MAAQTAPAGGNTAPAARSAVQSADATKAQGQAPGARQFFIDNIRWVVIGLVVLMHAAVTYSGLGSWYYKEGAPVDIISMMIFAFYQSFTQAFFMGLLFLIAGIFVPGAYDRKGFGRFLRDRLFRLGLPTLIYMLLVHPVTVLIRQGFLGQDISTATAAAYYRDYVLGLRFLGESGPLWFALALLFFSVVYALARAGSATLRRLWLKSRTSSPAGAPTASPGITNAAVATLIIVMGLVTFLVRVVAPIGTDWMNMQFCYFTQYVLLFMAGLWLGRRNLLERLPARFGMGWLRLALAAGIPAWFLIGGLGGAVTGSMDEFVTAMAGGWRWQAGAMALWESFFAVSFILGLLVIYRDRVNTRGPVTGFLSANAFGVYVFHAPILVAVTLLARPLALAPLVKTGAATLLTLAASLLVAALIRKVPGLRRVFS